MIFRPVDMVARLGGGEFVILVENISNEKQITPIAERILKELQEPITLEGHEIYIGASIGIVFSSQEYKKPDDLIRDADLAMYRAKAKGKGRYEMFDAQMHAGALSMLQLEIDLRHAIEREEFELHYQPIVRLNSDEVVGFEALVRWNHPVRGFIPPLDFIPIAEKTGLILPVGRWVLRQACRQMQIWQNTIAGTSSLMMSVNASAYELEQKDFVEQVTQIIEETQIDPRCLKLEITETVIMSNAEQTIKTVKQLRRMGVRVSMTISEPVILL